MAKSSSDLRHTFLQYFARFGHHIERSAPLIPYDDPTLLFVNAGMVPFKNVFLNKESRPYSRATSSQKCVRAGGKHNDLENVGQTARHHTFFEMLGNFSFGDYFKEEAIKLAWNFLTKEIGLDPSRLSVSIFAGDAEIAADEEAFRIWHEVVGLPKDKIKRLGRADNFWQMGDTGPCGPSSEIHFDRGDVKAGFGAQNLDDQVVEIWNLVFMQYEMRKDGSLIPLPAPCVDTGMGLERLTTVVNGLKSNYDTDLLRPLVDLAASLSQKTYYSSDVADDMAMRVIADHARATAFLVADGLFPGNEGRGYVLRRIMRRAIRYGALLGLHEIFFHKVCLKVVDIMGHMYPELIDARTIMERVVKTEEEAFRKTLDRGLQLFESAIGDVKGKKLSGSYVFRLHDTFGFPPDLTEILAKENGLTIDWDEFEHLKKVHEEKSAGSLGLKGTSDVFLQIREDYKQTAFINKPKVTASVLALVLADARVNTLSKGDQGLLLLDQSNFYGESGGQVGDTGTIETPQCHLMVTNTKKAGEVIVHEVRVMHGSITVGDEVTAQIDWSRRQDIMRNHSATHLLHAALRELLGNHVVQKGSLVAPERLRFDFAHFEAVSETTIKKIELLVNEWILANEAAKTQTMTMEEAKAYGAMALFGEKYQDKVRVLDMGSHSIELCGGTHCARTGDIGQFKIVSEAPLAQGVRRIEAVTGKYALALAQETERVIKTMAQKLSCSAHEVAVRLEQKLAELKSARKEIEGNTRTTLKDEALKAAQKKGLAGAIPVVVHKLSTLPDQNDLRTIADLVRDHIGSGVVALGASLPTGTCVLLVAVTKDLVNRVHAGELVKAAAPFIGGKGGGRPDFATAGGTHAEGLESALGEIVRIIEKQHNPQ